MTDDIHTETLRGYGRVSQRAPLDATIREDKRIPGRIALTTATAIGCLMGLVAYWIG